MATAAGDVTLPLLAVEGIAAEGRFMDGAVTLPLLVVSADVYHTTQIFGAVTLQPLRPEGSIQLLTRRMAGQVKLRSVASRGYLRNDIQLFSLTGDVRQNGSAILCFLGPPSRVIEWSIMQGAGVLVPYTPDVTDRWGRGFCLYHAGGYRGQLKVRVSYGN